MFTCSFSGIPLIVEDKEGKASTFLHSHFPTSHRNYQQPPSPFPGKNIYGIAAHAWHPMPDMNIGEYFYPSGAVRWSQFYGLATTAMKDAMAASALPASGAVAKPFVMQADVIGATTNQSHTITTSLFMLPPRPITQQGSTQGLWLITLVDERYYWQYMSPGYLQITSSMQWSDVISALATALGLPNINGSSNIPSVYLQPEPDSQLWSNYENAAFLLDAVAANVGSTLVRSLNGTYSLSNSTSAKQTIQSNIGSQDIRVAGGNIFTTANVQNAVLPEAVSVTFPKYVQGQTPYFINPRYTQTSRPSAWIEDSYGAVYESTVTISNAGLSVGGCPGVKTFRDTAKAIYNSENDGTPVNQAELDSLALQLAQNYYNSRTIGLDEVFPGMLAWQPEAVHDIVWTYKNGMVETRVFRKAWNQEISEFQHSSGSVTGVGGHSVAHTLQDTNATQIYAPNLLTFQDATISIGKNLQGLYEAKIASTGTHTVNGVKQGPCCCPTGNFTSQPSSWTFPAVGPWQGAAFYPPTGSPVVGTLPDPNQVKMPSLGSSQPSNPCYSIVAINEGQDLLYLVPNAGLIDGNISLSLFPHQSVWVFTDGQNYFSERGRFTSGVCQIKDNEYTLQPCDWGKTIQFIGEEDVEVVYPATIPDGWFVDIYNFPGDKLVQVNYADGNTADITYGASARLVSNGGIDTTTEYGQKYFWTKGITTNYIVQFNDIGRLLVFSAGLPVTCFLNPLQPGQGGLGDTFGVWIQNSGTDQVILTPTVGSFIDGQLTLSLFPRQGVWLSCDGVNFWTERGRFASGINTQLTNNYQLSVNDWGKTIMFAGQSGQDVNVTYNGTLPDGWFVDVYNYPTNSDKAIRINFPTGNFGLLSPGGSGRFVSNGGLEPTTEYGQHFYPTKIISQDNYVITLRDLGRNLVFDTGGTTTISGTDFNNVIMDLPANLSNIFGVWTTNIGFGTVTITATAALFDAADNGTGGSGSVILHSHSGGFITCDGQNFAVQPGVSPQNAVVITDPNYKISEKDYGTLLSYQGNLDANWTITNATKPSWWIDVQNFSQTGRLKLTDASGQFAFYATYEGSHLVSNGQPQLGEDAGRSHFGAYNFTGSTTITPLHKARVCNFNINANATASLGSETLYNSFGTFITNDPQSQGILTIAVPTQGYGSNLPTLDGTTYLTLAPKQGVWIGCDGSNYHTMRGRTSYGVKETTAQSYVLDPQDQNKLILFEAGNQIDIFQSISDPGANLPNDFTCGIRNAGGAQTYLKYHTINGGFDYLAPAEAYQVFSPDAPTDTGKLSSAITGFGLNPCQVLTDANPTSSGDLGEPTSSDSLFNPPNPNPPPPNQGGLVNGFYQLTPADKNRLTVLDTSTPATLMLPAADTGMLQVNFPITNIGTSIVTIVAPASTSIDNSGQLFLLPNHSVEVRCDGVSYWTQRGRYLNQTFEVTSNLTMDLTMWGAHMLVRSSADVYITVPVNAPAGFFFWVDNASGTSFAYIDFPNTGLGLSVQGVGPQHSAMYTVSNVPDPQGASPRLVGQPYCPAKPGLLTGDYTILPQDQGELLTFNLPLKPGTYYGNVGATVTIPFDASVGASTVSKLISQQGFWFMIQNSQNSALNLLLTVSNSGLIDGAANLTLPPCAGVIVCHDGVGNYRTLRGSPCSSSGSSIPGIPNIVRVNTDPGDPLFIGNVIKPNLPGLPGLIPGVIQIVVPVNPGQPNIFQDKPGPQAQIFVIQQNPNNQVAIAKGYYAAEVVTTDATTGKQVYQVTSPNGNEQAFVQVANLTKNANGYYNGKVCTINPVTQNVIQLANQNVNVAQLNNPAPPAVGILYAATYAGLANDGTEVYYTTGTGPFKLTYNTANGNTQNVAITGININENGGIVPYVSPSASSESIGSSIDQYPGPPSVDGSGAVSLCIAAADVNQAIGGVTNAPQNIYGVKTLPDGLIVGSTGGQFNQGHGGGIFEILTSSPTGAAGALFNTALGDWNIPGNLIANGAILANGLAGSSINGTINQANVDMGTVP